jgi:hypothetical protein
MLQLAVRATALNVRCKRNRYDNERSTSGHADREFHEFYGLSLSLMIVDTVLQPPATEAPECLAEVVKRVSTVERSHVSQALLGKVIIESGIVRVAFQILAINHCFDSFLDVARFGVEKGELGHDFGKQFLM